MPPPVRPSTTRLDLARPPDRVYAQTEADLFALGRSAEGWAGREVVVQTLVAASTVTVAVRSVPALKRLHLRWEQQLAGPLRILGDHWERGYGDLEWRGLVPERPLPWYFLLHDGSSTQGFGVRTGGASLAHFEVDGSGVSLWLDLRCGGRGVDLRGRLLEAATLVARKAVEGESPMAAACGLCKQLCERPRLPKGPIYGGNSWYSSYGTIDAELVRRMSGLVAEASPAEPRPFMVVDSGWQQGMAIDGAPGGPWRTGNAGFPAMDRMAAEMRALGVRPGIWIRPLVTTERPQGIPLLAADRFAARYPGALVDPSTDEGLALVRADHQRLVAEWGYELVKHDFTTYDLTGLWGFQMGRSMTPDGWSFTDRSRTTAEILVGLYRTIREACGEALVIGCNTVGHLGAGLFDLQRTGDDTSGREYERTRRMGVNTLAFRMAQQGTFFAVDADCAPLTRALRWDRAAMWLDLLARSGTPLFVSPEPEAMGSEQKRALREAFTRAAKGAPPAEPLDWMETTCPKKWRFGNETVTYDWFRGEGIDAP